MRRTKKSKIQARPTKKKKAARTTLKVISRRTGLTHHINDVSQLEKLTAIYETKYNSKQKADIGTAAGFDSFISKQVITTRPDYIFKGKAYRVVSPNVKPLSVSGSLADGGRFNIGGAQLTPLFPHLKKWSALYSSETLTCALQEAQKPLGQVTKCELLYKGEKEIILWDLKKVITELNFPNLDQILKETPVEAIWGYQKIPKPSQVLAHYLMKIGGDGIVFESTKSPAHLNFTFFFWDDDAAKETFSASIIE